ncbi:hypothetical protein BAU08_21185 [Bordetella bronchialis]|uniref:Uncharacterized protein n=1 Tax=Bordetella bronchialis TaxID=463025 RepID=A0A193G1I4_9BORD|nr:hypothetical protein BAU06_20655 [Bordetella bronchialis]ANN73528.1 hypothetical protein BAU08_21185 [Bordetella bronchialis]
MAASKPRASRTAASPLDGRDGAAVEDAAIGAVDAAWGGTVDGVASAAPGRTVDGMAGAAAANAVDGA